jgi:hypothetical protein
MSCIGLLGLETEYELNQIKSNIESQQILPSEIHHRKLALSPHEIKKKENLPPKSRLLVPILYCQRSDYLLHHPKTPQKPTLDIAKFVVPLKRLQVKSRVFTVSL